MSTRFIKNGGAITFPRHRDDKSRTPDDLVVCPVEKCGKAFVDAAALARHGKKVHENLVRTYRCPACGVGEVKPEPRDHGHWEWTCQNRWCRSNFGNGTKPLVG